MLESIAGLEPTTARDAISFSMSRLGADVLIGDGHVDGRLSDRIISEVREIAVKKGAINPLEIDREASKLLSEQASIMLMSDNDIDKVLDELGAKGDLLPSMYTSKDSIEFKDSRESIGFARQCISKSDGYNHFFASEEVFWKQWSLFLKVISGGGKYSDSLCLVHANRVGITLTIQSLWHVFPDIVEVDEISPLGVLKSFCSHYGLSVMTNGLERPVKLILDHRVPMNEQAEVPYGVIPDRDTDWFAGPALYRWEENYLEFAYAYVIDLKAYHADFARRRVRRDL